MTKRKVPLRKCLGCNESKAKKELIRIVKNKEDEIFIDATGKANGRGAYVCNNSDCFKMLKKGRKLDKAFKTQVPNAIYEGLIKEIEASE